MKIWYLLVDKTGAPLASADKVGVADAIDVADLRYTLHSHLILY
jgi:hypothetical protein